MRNDLPPALSNRDLTQKWCDGFTEPLAASPPHTLRPRNTFNHVPMYGCIVDDGCAPFPGNILHCNVPRPFLMYAIVDAQGQWVQGFVHAQTRETVNDWMDWLRRPSRELVSVTHIGYEERWPQRPDESRVLRLLPLVCSINPMGTPYPRDA